MIRYVSYSKDDVNTSLLPIGLGVLTSHVYPYFTAVNALFYSCSSTVKRPSFFNPDSIIQKPQITAIWGEKTSLRYWNRASEFVENKISFDWEPAYCGLWTNQDLKVIVELSVILEMLKTSKSKRAYCNHFRVISNPAKMTL